MRLDLLNKEDPLNILSSTKVVVGKAKNVFIDETKLDSIVSIIENRLKKGLETPEDGFGAKMTFVNNVQHIFLQDVVNFCFWAEKDKPKWQIEYPIGSEVKGGAYAMIACFNRGLAEKIPMLDADYLCGLTLDQVRHFFRSNNGTDIPLLEKRLENLLEAGKVLNKNYQGRFVNAVEESKYDAVKLVEIIFQNFSSFRDVARYDGKDVYFLKRAQIAVNDISYLAKTADGKPLSNLASLTAFADYKLPQMLRQAGVLNYAPLLAQKVDDYILIASGSNEEIEIRAATIWAIELIRQKLQKYTAAEIDNALWLLSQDQTGLKPYHRTYTIFY